MKKIGIQGGRGSYTELAALKMHTHTSIQYCETFTEAFQTLRDGNVESIVVAIANNRVQFIPDTHEQLMASDNDLSIVGETYLRIEHALLALPGSSMTDITEVHSQTPALGQCSHFLENELPNAHIVEEHDTAGSAKLVAESGNIQLAAIASIKAGELHGLKPLKTSIQDDKDNITRFVEISLAAKGGSNAKANKTSMLLVTTQTAGSLAKVLNSFANVGINLSYLQSRIIPNSPFDIDFFVEFDAGTEEARTKQVLREIQELGYSCIVLGSYEAAEIPAITK